MLICDGIIACARYVIGLVLLLGAATALNVAIVLGWNSLDPEAFGEPVAAAVISDGSESVTPYRQAFAREGR